MRLGGNSAGDWKTMNHSDPSSQSSRIPQHDAISYVRDRSKGGELDPSWRITLNFHPDGFGYDVPVVEQLADGFYRSQFETGTSNGGLTAYPGGDRWRWESRLFGGFYDLARPSERPKYGALNDRNSPYGGSPRFGSSHLRLHSSVNTRCTFCYPDSYCEPSNFGVHDRMSLVSLLELDRHDPTVDKLDMYIEAHIHGPVSLEHDVDALVLDPCYRGTEIDHASSLLPCPVEWHPGLELKEERLVQNVGYRSDDSLELGLSLLRDGPVTARCIAVAARRGDHSAGTLKHLWHYVACFGEPITSGS